MKRYLRIWLFRAARACGMAYGTPPVDWAPMAPRDPAPKTPRR